MKLRILFLAMLLSLPAAAERTTEHNFHGWYTYFGDHPVVKGSKWGLHLEAQVRRHDVIRTWQQLLLRPGVNYQLNRTVMLTEGYAFVRSHSYSSASTARPALNEHRIWHQAWLRYGLGKVRLSTRVRLENRFIGVYDAAGRATNRYENRLRMWEQVTVPVSKRFYLTAYDELWFYIKPYVSSSAFDQNRLYGGIGVNLRPTMRFETAYMNQTLLQRSGARLEQNHTLVFSLFSTAALFGGT